MFRKVQITFLIFTSSSLIIFGGYNCARQITFPPSGNTNYNQGPSGNYGNQDLYGDPNSYANQDPIEPEDPTKNLLPEDPGLTHCKRSERQDLSDAYGASAFIRLDTGVIEDYRLGIRSNFDPECTRMYVNFKPKATGRTGKEIYKNFKGNIAITYEGKVRRYKTGYTERENFYNQWYDSNTFDDEDPAEGDAPKRGTKLKHIEFYAILDDAYGAIIFHIKRIYQKDIRDGEQALIGSGDVWYKMFKSFVWADRHKPCYKSGTYVSKLPQVPPRSSTKCWFLSQGPYSCKPNGVGTRMGTLLYEDQANDFACYEKLGSFGNLNVREAFNVRNGNPWRNWK
ncbi:MAG: hypothetical protein ACR2M7_04320 [Bdellovibrionales bacterium]